MKKRLFRNLLMLGLLLVALTAAVSAASIFYDRVHANNGRTITFTFEANYYCQRDNIKTPVTDPSSYEVKQINSWTSDQIVFQIDVISVRCAGDDSGTHIEHSSRVTYPSKTVTFTGSDLCHKAFTLTEKITNVVYYNWNDALEFTVTTEEPRYQLVRHEVSEPTCTEYGYSQPCYECLGCGKLFADQNAETALSDSVRRNKTGHKYNENGVCQNCDNEAEAYTLDSGSKTTYYQTVEAALEDAYKTPNDLSVWITRYDRKDIITLTDTCHVYVCENVEIPEICMPASEQQITVFDIINRGGTIGKISFSDITSGNSVQATIYNDSGSIGTITPASSGTQALDITNKGDITQIDIPDNGSLRMEIKNNKDAAINTIQGQQTDTVDGKSVTIQNNGTITRLVAKKPIKLLSGTGTYTSLTTEKTGSRSGELLDDGCKFYLTYDKEWHGSEYTMQGFWYFIVSTPPFSVTVNGPAGFQSDGSGGYSLTLAAKDVQNQTLSTSLSYPNANTSLSSEGAEFTYGWYYADDDTASWKTTELPLNELPVGIHQLTLRVTDSAYNYTHSINVTVTITSEGKVPVSLQTPEGSFTKMYDGTANVPENLSINFTASGKELVLHPVTSDEKVGYRIVKAAYNSPDCKDAATITVKVELTKAAKEIYTLETDEFTVNGTITKFKPEGTSIFFRLNVSNRTAHVGAHIMSCLTADNVKFEKYWDNKYAETLDPLGVNPDITYYRMRTDGIYDPTTDEKLTENSIFAYEGDYKIYAVIGETDNYAELFTEYTTITANSASDGHTHCRYGHSSCDDVLPTYTAFTGSSLSPDGSQGQLSYYLNAAKSTVNLTLILRQLRDSSSENPSLDLCLYGKTLRADSEYAEQFRVSNKWHLTLTDCVGTGVLKGTSVDDEHGGCLYVADATVDISNIKITGGSSSKLGGAIDVGKDGTLNLYSGEISGNHVTSGKGGAIYIKSGGVVNIYGGTIQDNHVYSGNGGAIYVENGATLNLYGGTITGNTASGLGGGIYVETGGKVTIQGNPVVTGNTAGGKPNNLYVCVDTTSPLLTISGELADGAKLGVSTDASYPVLLAGSNQDYSAYFTPDDPDAFVLFSGSALTLCAKPSATLEGDTLTVSTGRNYQSDAFVLFVAEYAADGRLLAVHSEKITAESGTYTFKVQNSGATIKCFLLRTDTYTPLFGAFSPNA